MTFARRLRAAAAQSLPILFATLLLVTGPAGAVTVDGLYRAEVEVVGKGGEARADGFRRALEQVLVRVSGSSAIAANPDIEALLASPDRFVQRFQYDEIESEGEDEPAARAASGDGEQAQAPTHRLRVQFAQGRIERALRERGLVIWGAQRPEVLLWLAVDDGDQRRIVSVDGVGASREHLLERARERGLPVMLPLMDMEDRSRVEYVDIQGGFLDAVQAASERYRPTAMLVGHVRPRGREWAGDWHLLGVGERKSWSTAGGALGSAVAAGVDGATDRVARAFAGRGEDARELRLRVTEVEGLDAYARVSEYLMSLVRVRSAEVLELKPGEVVFRVTMNGRMADLERAITLGSTLSRVRGGQQRADAARAADDAVDANAGPDAATGASPGQAEPPAAVELTFRLVG